MKQILFFLFIYFFGFSNALKAQEDTVKIIVSKIENIVKINPKKPTRIWGARFHYGFVLGHRQGMRHLIKGHVPAFEVFFDKHVSGYKLWHRLYRFPNQGWTFYFNDLGNPEELGKVFLIYRHLNLKIYQKKTFILRTKIGTGIAFLTKSFDQKNNFKNIAIGSKINGSMVLGLEARYRFKHLALAGNFQLTHFSNGSFSLPNLGLNVPSIGLTFQYFSNRNLNQVWKLIGDSEMKSTKKKPLSYKISVLPSFGIKEVIGPGGEKHMTYNLFALWQKQNFKKTSWGIGADVFYNTSHFVFLEENAKKLDILQLGVNLNYILNLDEFEILFQNGFYVLDRNKLDGLIYHRVGGRYYFSKRFFGSFMLKTHFFKADNFEMGIGIKIK